MRRLLFTGLLAALLVGQGAAIGQAANALPLDGQGPAIGQAADALPLDRQGPAIGQAADAPPLDGQGPAIGQAADALPLDGQGPAIGRAADSPPQDLEQIAAAIAAAKGRLDASEQALATTREAAAALAAEVQRLRAGAGELDAAREAALVAMREQFERIVADPTLDLAEAQTNYRLAGVVVQQHADTISAKQQEAAATAARVTSEEQALATIAAGLQSLERDLAAARVARLHRELNVTGEISLGNTVACRPDETIAGCMERAQAEVRTRALEMFVDRIYAAASEADLIARQRNPALGGVSLLDSQITDSGFQGQGDYRVELTAKVGNRTSEAEACRLLGLDTNDCTALAKRLSARPAAPAPAAPATEPAATETPASGQFLLTVRSNARLDEVFIDGVSYGSTKVDVLLPAGAYDLEVRKQGYQSFHQQVQLDRPTTVKATLAAE